MAKDTRRKMTLKKKKIRHAQNVKKKLLPGNDDIDLAPRKIKGG